jgi:hypothetical protein
MTDDLDQRIEDKIDELEQERLRLREEEVESETATLEADRVRLDEIGVELDRLWDWLRQRRALRAAGQDPDDAHERDASVVERYLQ